jgi:hypothetical protein
MWLASLENGEIFFVCFQWAHGVLQVSMGMAWHAKEHATAFVWEPTVNIMDRAVRCEYAKTTRGISLSIDHIVMAALIPSLVDDIILSKIWPARV